MGAKHGTGYTVGFVVAVCLVCSVFVCVSAVGLKERQEYNRRLDRQKNVLAAAGLLGADETADNARIERLFEQIVPVVVELKTGAVRDDVDAASVDMRTALTDSSASYRAPQNDAKIQRLPKLALVYRLMEDGQVSAVILPVRGKGLWSTLYGFLALDTDGATVKGVSFYEHGETPGLGGEIESAKWTEKWKGKQVVNDAFEPAFKVRKGDGGASSQDAHSVDGLSGATLTGNGVTALVNFWVGKNGFGPFLDGFRKGGV